MAHIQDRGKDVPRRWQARYRDPSGVEKSKTFVRKLDAQRWLDMVTADLVTGKYVDPRGGRVTLNEFAMGWLDSQTFDPSTLETTERILRLHILPVLGHVELKDIRPSMVQAWLASRGGAASSVRTQLVYLSAMLSAAVDDGLISSNPCRSSSVKPPAIAKKRLVPWTVDQAQAVIDVHPIRYRAIPTIAAGCGLRQGEVFGLHVDDVDFLRRRILVRRQVKIVGSIPMISAPKGGREREVPLPDVVGLAISEHLRQNGAVDGRLFSWKDDGLIHRTYFNNRIWKPSLVKAGIPATRDNGFHALRHHYASVLLDGGVSIRALADYLGHSDPGFTLRIYAHLMPETEDKARNVVDAAFGAPAESGRNEGPAIGGIVN